MTDFTGLIGVPFITGKNDCYGLVRAFYKLNYNIELTNYARSNDWWERGHDLINKNYFDEGFYLLDVHPSEWRVGDMFLMSIKSPVPNHLALLVENNKIIHHFTNRLSEVESYKGIWKNSTVGIVRHRDVKLPAAPETVNILDVLPEPVRRNVNEKLDTLQSIDRQV